MNISSNGTMDRALTKSNLLLLVCSLNDVPQWLHSYAARGHYHHGMFRNQSGTYDEMSGSLGRWLSMTTAMGVYAVVKSYSPYTSMSFLRRFNLL